MPLPEPRPGTLIRYEYLWADEHAAGRDEGAKERPCAIVVATRKGEGGATMVTVVPVTHSPHRADGVELAPDIKARLGLDEAASWVVCSEVNRFAWPGPDLRPVPGRGGWSYGVLPLRVLEGVQAKLLAAHRRSRVRVVSRTS
jgi:PemK-like, MazF-like toxin of type II toxin-antitoxin system